MIQVVCVKWGTKYAASHVNGMYRAVLDKTKEDVRFVCITDQPDDGYDEGIDIQPFPDFGVPFKDMQRGCRAKLSIFFDGVLQPGLETIFVDLDTIICGDLGVLAARLRENPGLYLMRGHWVPFWRISAIAKRVFPRKYYFGNSSVLAFYPEDFYALAELFKRKLQTGESYFRKSLNTDDRFISCFARDRIRVFSPRDAVKFSSEFMTPLPIIEKVRKRLPWVASRRKALVAVTFAGVEIKPETIANFQSGQIVKVKNSYVVWDYEEYSRYWRNLSERAA